ncbi:MAG: LysM peptidoglycan-binding domain-containing protein [Anaerolineae bacterium]|nr:LysM peptidoglycan-binding domain-containing protein [Anaerolineae bacterium]
MRASKGRWISLIIVLVLVNYLVISSLTNLVARREQVLSATPTRTPKPTFTPDLDAFALVRATPTPRPPTATPTSVGLSTPTPPATPTPAVSPTPSVVTHVVQAGETLLDIAIRYGVSQDAILALNDLASPDLIYAGQTLRIPVPPTPGPTAPAAEPDTPAPLPTAVVHVVQPGDTLLSISYQYRADLREIRRVNNLQGDAIYVGQRLVIPKPGVVPGSEPTATPATGRQHVVRAGETLSGIAWQYGVTVEAILAANGLQSPDLIYVGQVLIIPEP